MGKRSPVITLARQTDSPAVRADDHLHRDMTLQPVLAAHEAQVVNALILPQRVGALPEEAEHADCNHILQAVTGSGLILGLRDNARRAGLADLYRACVSMAERQRFIGRERWNVAKEAARRIQEATGRPPTALGALAATHLVYASPASRLRDAIRFLVPRKSAAKARLAVASLRGVEVTSHIIPGSSPRSWDEAVRLRGSALVDEGWQLPAPEDAALLILPDIGSQRGARRTAALVDLILLTRHPDFRWDVFAQRTRLWRLRPAAWGALQALKRRFAHEVPEAVLKRIEPTPWERLLKHVIG